MDELTLMRNINRDFSSSCVLCYTETWLGEDTPDCALQLEGFHLLRADRDAALAATVYIPPDADVHKAQRALAKQILCIERAYPDSLIIVLGDFNKANLSQELPKTNSILNAQPERKKPWTTVTAQ
uniref:Endonuclease/exonuclease/phosphatase domain-containing protein n=1 Tax=Iconisemion striatum TaxID=60296 RepID=A0A1A7YB78_9TELE